MGREEHAFTTIELLVVVAVLGIVSAMAVPSVLNTLRDYRLHSDTSALASLCNLARLRAAAQYAPYRVNISVTAGTYSMEKLCGNACTSPYTALATPPVEMGGGTQYLQPGNTLASCRPSGISAYPGTITVDSSGCPNLVQVYFNTRGMPVDSTGNPLANGGTAVYVQNQNGMVDALTLSVGGQAAVWNWGTSASIWYLR